MAAPANLDWLYQVAGWTLAAAGVVLLLWALFWDRSRGRRRCPKCWYDMAGVPGLRCPECGRETRQEKRLSKTRRRYRRAAIALVVAIAGLGATLYPGLRSGWAAAIPSWILANIAGTAQPAGTFFVGGVPVAAPMSIRDTITQEAWTRLADGRLHGWPARRLVHRCLDSSGWTAQKSLRLPDAWPVDRLIPCSVKPPYFLGGNCCELEFRVAGEHRWVSQALQVRGSELVLPACDGPATDLELEVRIIRSRRPVIGRGTAPGNVITVTQPPDGGEVFHSTRLRVPIRVRGGQSDFLETTSGQAIDSLVQRVLDPRLIRTADGQLFLGINDTSSAAIWRGIDFGISFRAQLLIGTDVVAEGEGSPEWGRAVWKDWEEVPLEWTGRERLESTLSTDRASVQLRIRGAPDLACAEYLRNPFAKPRPLCWSGSFQVPARLAGPGSTATDGATP